MDTTMRRFTTGHVGLNVSDLRRSLHFYRTVFGFEVQGESQADGRRFALLGDAGGLVLTLWEQSRGGFERARPGLHHLSFEVAGRAEVERAERAVRALGAPLLYDGIVPHAEGAASGGIFFEDPDGIRLEIYSPDGAGGRPAPTADAPSCGFF